MLNERELIVEDGPIQSKQEVFLAVKQTVTNYWPVFGLFPVVVILLVNHVRWEATFRYADLAFFSDDLFYYLQVARHILQSGHSTFDGMTSTNGYHPMWMATMLAFGQLCGGINTVFFICFRILLGILCIVSGVLLLRLCRWVFEKEFLSTTVFVYFYYLIIRLTVTGMEVALAIPLLLAFILSLLDRGEPLRLRHVVAQTLLGVVAILSRLDAIIFVLPALGTVLFADGSVRRRIGLCILSMTIVGILMGVYFAWNQIVFGSWMPISGVAKGLKTSLQPSLLVAESLFVPRYLNQFFMVFLPWLLVLFGSVYWVACGRVAWEGRQRWIAGWVLCFPAVYYVTLMVRSDWSLWPWYYYPLPLAGIVAARVLWDGVTRVIGCESRRAIAFVGFMLVVAYVGISTTRVWMLTPVRNPCYRTALDVEAFAKDHPGVYAMGDQAGLASFVTGLRIVQLEGLVCDRTMIEYIKKKADLLHVLRTYGVQYYVTVQDMELRGTSRVASEPAQAGDLSAKMTGIFNCPPVCQTKYPDPLSVSIFSVIDEH